MTSEQKRETLATVAMFRAIERRGPTLGELYAIMAVVKSQP